MKTETKVGIGVIIALLGYYLYTKSKKNTGSTITIKTNDVPIVPKDTTPAPIVSPSPNPSPAPINDVHPIDVYIPPTSQTPAPAPAPPSGDGGSGTAPSPAAPSDGGSGTAPSPTPAPAPAPSPAPPSGDIHPIDVFIPPSIVPAPSPAPAPAPSPAPAPAPSPAPPINDIHPIDVFIPPSPAPSPAPAPTPVPPNDITPPNGGDYGGPSWQDPYLPPITSDPISQPEPMPISSEPITESPPTDIVPPASSDPMPISSEPTPTPEPDLGNSNDWLIPQTGPSEGETNYILSAQQSNPLPNNTDEWINPYIYSSSDIIDTGAGGGNEMHPADTWFYGGDIQPVTNNNDTSDQA